MAILLQDVKHAFRVFRKNPGFTAAALAALALGIGTNTAIFSVVDAVLLKPAPFPDSERIVLFENTSPQGSGTNASPAKFEHWRAQTSVVQDVSAFRTSVVNLTGGEFPEQIQSGQVSADFFRLFGARVLRGRTFTSQEDLPHAGNFAVISEGLWSRRFGGDPAIVGKTISLGGQPHVVLGVISSSFDFRDFGNQPDVWLPFQFDPNTTDQGHFFTAAGRLKPGVSLEQAQARLKFAADEYRRKYPNTLNPNGSFSVEPVREAMVKNVRPILLVLLGAVALVLLIACANVANLLLARAVVRKREIAIRAAIGAGRGRIVRQLLTESVLLSLGGAVAGGILGIIGIRALLFVNTADLPRVGQNGSLVSLDWRVLAFTVLVAAATGLLFGLFPALQASRTDLGSTLKESGRGGSGLRRNKARTVLVIAETTLATVLLIASALLIRTSLALGSVKPGFEASNLLTMRMSLASPRFATSAAIERLVREGVERIEALPGVEIASAACCVPTEGGYGLPFAIEGRPLTDGPSHGGGAWVTVSPGYFKAFRIPVLRGRTFNERDDPAGAPVVIINQAMARQFWPKSDPLSDRIWIGKGLSMKELATEKSRQIIAVVGDVRNDLGQEPQPAMYVPNAQVPDALNALNVNLIPMKWLIRTRGNPYALSAAIQEQLRQVAGLPVTDVRSMDEVLSRATSRQRFNMLLMTIFAGAALCLAAIGIYGLMAYSVQQRTREIGIRLALGAEPGQMRNMVVLQGMTLAVIGVAAGVGAAFGATRVLAAFLFGVKARDPIIFATMAAVLCAVSLFAVWFPARRATQVDAVTALRYE